MRMPRDIGPFHIVGIGGIGMSAIAEVMHHRGYDVRGSDLKASANVQRLMDKGIICFIGHDPANIEGAEFVVLSSAVKPGNPEYEAAREMGLPIISRAEMLAELMRECATVSVTGTHGKTTTTSIIAELLHTAGKDPTVISGGIIANWGSNARIGQGPEHMDFWQSLESLHGAFKTYFDNIPFYGLVIAGLDHPIVREMIAQIGRDQTGKRVLTYGVADDADLRLSNYHVEDGVTVFDVDVSESVPGGARSLKSLRLPMPGEHNALNALAAFGVATEIGIPDDQIRAALGSFGGVARRFMLTGTWNGVPIYDDYAHHPVEIEAVLKAARSAADKRVIAIVQPHRYTRLKNLFGDFCTCFDDADTVIVTPVYSAGEQPIEGADRDALIEGLKRQGHEHVLPVDDEEHLAALVAELAKPGDLVIGMGAGTITEWTHALPKRLKELE
ncbi:MAG: UDP-N-acetylmuramate--L-alanine ligase [Alphaproteobacteria bacterium]